MLRRGLLGLIAIGTVGVTACRLGPRHGRTVVFASGAELQTLNPLFTTHPLAKQIERYVLLTTLVRYDARFNVRPYLARSWDWSTDHRALILHLFRGLRWEDGAPTTARDAAWTLEAARDPATGFPRLNDLESIAAIAAADDTTLVLRFASPPSGIPDVLTDLAILPAHLLDTVPHARMRSASWNAQPVGNGPFRVVLHETNRRWVFAARPEFPAALGGPPRLDRFVVVMVDEPTTKLSALATGEVDFAGIQPAHAAFVRRDSDLTLFDYPTLRADVIVFNARRSPFDDRRVRTALSLALDRQAIVDGYLYGFGTAADSPLSPALQSSAHHARAADPEVARGLLGGRRIAFELLTVGSGEAPLEQMVQAQLRPVGFDVSIRQVELSAYLDRVYGRPDFQAAVLGIGGEVGQGYLATLARLAGVDRDSLPAAFLYYARGLQGANRRVHGVQMDFRGELPTVAQWSVAP